MNTSKSFFLLHSYTKRKQKLIKRLRSNSCAKKSELNPYYYYVRTPVIMKLFCIAEKRCNFSRFCYVSLDFLSWKFTFKHQTIKVRLVYHYNIFSWEKFKCAGNSVKRTLHCFNCIHWNCVRLSDLVSCSEEALSMMEF